REWRGFRPGAAARGLSSELRTPLLAVDRVPSAAPRLLADRHPMNPQHRSGFPAPADTMRTPRSEAYATLSANVRGIVAMLAAVATFAVMDLSMKRLVETYPAIQVTARRHIASAASRRNRAARP